jgi:hypothetical protein
MTDRTDAEFAAAMDAGEPVDHGIGVNGAQSDEPHREPFSILVMTAKELCEQPDPDGSEELLGGLVVRRQRTVIGADTGAGKTSIAFAMLSAITCKRELLGFDGAGGRALVIDAEQGIRTLKKRLREAKLDESELVDFIRVPDGLALDSDEQQVAVIGEKLATGCYDVVLADPLYKLHRGDSNVERAAVDLMRRLDGWREQYGFALILLVHTRKPPVGAKFSMNEFFGSSAYLRGAEIVLGLQLVRDGYSRLHFFKDRDGDLPIRKAWGLLFDRESGYRRDPEDGARRPTAAQQVAELLGDDPTMTDAQLIAATGKSERTIRDARKAAQREPAQQQLGEISP